MNPLRNRKYATIFRTVKTPKPSAVMEIRARNKRFTDAKKRQACTHENIEGGYGLMGGGGPGTYTYCTDCYKVINKVQDLE